MKINIIIQIVITFMFYLLIYNYVYHKKEEFIDYDRYLKKCNKFKRQCKAKITLIKSGVERKVSKNLENGYNISKNVLKKIVFPKEIKISF